jgi:hypothetical protein
MAVEDIGARSPAEINLPDRYRDRLRLASSEGEPGVEAVNGYEPQAIAKFVYMTLFACFASI